LGAGGILRPHIFSAQELLGEMADRLDIVSVRVEDKCAVIVLMIMRA
jgi:hypothetical protein